MILPILLVLLGCADEDSTPSVTEPAAQASTDACCVAGSPGEPRWDECQDSTVLSHVCKRAEICCTVQWAEPCAKGYAQFAPTCLDTDSVTPPSQADPASADKADPAASSTTPPQSAKDRLRQLEDIPRLKVSVSVTMEPAPDVEGGNIFYAGFIDIDERVGMPTKDAQPVDYGTMARWVKSFPLTEELELYKGLHYFVMYGFGEHPMPGDRMTSLQAVTDASPLTFSIGTKTIPRDNEVPEGGYEPGEEPEGPPEGVEEDDAPPPPGPPPSDGEPAMFDGEADPPPEPTPGGVDPATVPQPDASNASE